MFEKGEEACGGKEGQGMGVWHVHAGIPANTLHKLRFSNITYSGRNSCEPSPVKLGYLVNMDKKRVVSIVS